MREKREKKMPSKQHVVVKLEPDEYTLKYRDLEKEREAEKDADDCWMSLSEHVRMIWPEIDIMPKIEPVVKQEPTDLDIITIIIIIYLEICIMHIYNWWVSMLVLQFSLHLN